MSSAEPIEGAVESEPCQAVATVDGQAFHCELDWPHTGIMHFKPKREGEPAIVWQDHEAVKAMRGGSNNGASA